MNEKILSYFIGFFAGKEAGKSDVVFDGTITCTDDGEGNITITQEE